MPIAVFDSQDVALQFELMTFSGGERHIQLDIAKPSPFYTLRADLRDSTDVLDLLLLTNALNAHSPHTKLYVEIPYLPYARQDRVCAPGQAFSMKVLADILSTIDNIEELVVWDCHSPVGVDLTAATNISGHQIMVTHAGLSAIMRASDSVVICPDKGAIGRTEETAKAFGNAPIVYCEKVRDPATGQITHTQVNTETLAGKTAIITDDICDGGYTFIKIAEQLKAKGAARIILFVTHGIFSKGLGVFDGLIDEIFTTSSFKHAPAEALTVIDYSHKFRRANNAT